MNKKWVDIRRYWDYYLVALFILVRIIINIDRKPLMIFFALVHVALFLMLIYKTKYFVRIFVLFLAIDSMIGTYLATNPQFGMMAGFGLEFYSTMFVNFFFIWILITNRSKKFMH